MIDKVRIEDPQEFQIYRYLKEHEDLKNKAYEVSKITVLLSEISSIGPVPIEDRSNPDADESYIYLKSGESFAAVAEYEKLRNVWIKFLKQ